MPNTPWQFSPFAGPGAALGTPQSNPRSPFILFEEYPANLEAPAWGAGNPPPPGDFPGGLTVNRRFIRAFWGGIAGPSVTQPANLPVSPALVISRRAPRPRAIVGNSNQAGGGIAVPVPASSIVVHAPPLILRSLRFPPRAVFRGIAVLPQQPQLLPRPPPTAVAVRPLQRISRAVWTGTVVRTVNAASATPSGSLQPLSTARISRRTSSRVFWAGSTSLTDTVNAASCLLLINGAESQASGTTITPANSAPPNNAFDVVSITNSGTATYDSTHIAHGAEAFSFSTTATGGQAFVAWSTSFGFPAQFWYRFYIFLAANPSINFRPFSAFGSTVLASLSITTTGTLRFLDHNGTVVPLSNGSTTSTTSIVGQWVRIEGSMTLSPTNGQATASIYLTPDSTIPTETIFPVSGVNFGTPSSGTTYRFGLAIGAANIAQFWVDDVALSSCGPIGPVGVPPATSLSQQLIKRRTAARAQWFGTVVRTVNASTAGTPSGSIQPLATVPSPHRLHPRALAQGIAVPGLRSAPVTNGLVKRRSSARAVWLGKDVPGIRSAPITNGLIRRRSTARGIWGGLIGPPRQIPVTGGLIKRRSSARAVWSGRAVPGVLGVPVMGTGLVKRRSSARVTWAGTLVRTVNATPQFGPPGSQPGSGLVKRRTSARAFIQFTPVRTVNAIPLNGSLQPRPTISVPRRTTARAVLGGLRGLAALSFTKVGGLVVSRRVTSVWWGGTAVSTVNATPQFGPPGSQPGSGLVKRRTSARAFIQFTPVRTVNFTQPPSLPITPPHLVIGRRTAARAVWLGNAAPGRLAGPVTGGLVKRRTSSPVVWRGTVVRTKNQILLSGSIQPHPIVARRTVVPVVWRGNPVPWRRSAPVTGGLVKRRTTAPAVWRSNAAPPRRATSVIGGLIKRRTGYPLVQRGVIVRTTNALPVPGSQPGGVIQHRNAARTGIRAFIWFKPVILNVLGIPFENIIITLGAPRTHWATGNAGVRWEQASATLRWRASDPVANHWQKGSPQIRWRDGP